jgi:hypothetical protein
VSGGLGAIRNEIAHFQVNVDLLLSLADWGWNALEFNRTKIQREGALLSLDAITIAIQESNTHRRLEFDVLFHILSQQTCANNVLDGALLQLGRCQTCDDGLCTLEAAPSLVI